MLEKIFTVIFGLCVGSFLNVCIYRLPKNISIVKPPSHCPKCKNPIKWYDNIPILSYIFLGAKCRNCKESISFRYPLVEGISAVLFLIFYLKFGFTLQFAKFVLLFCLLVIISFIDIDYRAVPDYLLFGGILTGLIFSFFQSARHLKEGIFDLAVLPISISLKDLIFTLGLIYLFKLFADAFIRLYLTMRKKDSIEGEKESLGLGDVDFMGIIGIFLGVKKAILVFFLAPFLGIVYVVFALIFKKSHVIAYLPYLSLSTFGVFWWGDKILNFLF